MCQPSRPQAYLHQQQDDYDGSEDAAQYGTARGAFGSRCGKGRQGYWCRSGLRLWKIWRGGKKILFRLRYWCVWRLLIFQAIYLLSPTLLCVTAVVPQKTAAFMPELLQGKVGVNMSSMQFVTLHISMTLPLVPEPKQSPQIVPVACLFVIKKNKRRLEIIVRVLMP